VFQQFRFDQHVNAIDWAGLNAERTASAVVGNDSVVLFGSTKDGIHRARLDAERTTDALILTDECDHRSSRLIFNSFGLKPHQVCNLEHGAFATGNAVVHLCFTTGNGNGIGFAAGVSTLAALSLWQKRFYLLNHRVALNLENTAGNSEKNAD